VRILITTLGSYGDVNPYVGLALALRGRGHTPVIATSPFYRGYVEAAGIEFHPMRPDLDPHDRALVRRIMDPGKGSEFIVRDLILGALRESYDDLVAAARGADAILTHPVTFAGPVVAEKVGLPWISTVLAPMSFFSAHDLPVFPPAPWAKRLERVPGAARALVRMARAASRGWGEPVYALRRELGLSRGGDPVFEGQHSPRGVLALFSRLLARPQPDWPPNVRVTGAIPWDGAGARPALSAALAAFLDDGPPPLVFTLGSSAVGAAGGFYQESAQAARRLGMRAVLLAGAHPENRPRGPLPPGVIVEEFAAHSALFPRASAIVHQGGAGTLHQALRSGRPTLVVPFAHDQPDNAWRVRRLGVSRTLRPGRYRASRAARELRTLLDDPAYAARAARVGEQVRAEGGADAACDAVQALLSAASAPGG
jgi:rhamnosyltransferase subunit B